MLAPCKVLEEGSVIGERAMVEQWHKRLATVRAVTFCEVFRIKRVDFMHMLEDFPDVS